MTIVNEFNYLVILCTFYVFILFTCYIIYAKKYLKLNEIPTNMSKQWQNISTGFVN